MMPGTRGTVNRKVVDDEPYAITVEEAGGEVTHFHVVQGTVVLFGKLATVDAEDKLALNQLLNGLEVP